MLARRLSTVGFDQTCFNRYLATETFGRSLHSFETLDSTNTRLWELIAHGACPGTAVVATQQEAGRGQWGRTWCSAPGGLYLSVAIAPQIPATQTQELTICSAWGVATILRAHQIPVVLKWPNDLYVDGYKLAGILTETSVQQGVVHQAVIGIGLNWQNPVPVEGINLQRVLERLPQPTIDSLEMLTALTLQGLEEGYQRWQKEGIEGLLPDYFKLVMLCKALE